MFATILALALCIQDGAAVDRCTHLDATVYVVHTDRSVSNPSVTTDKGTARVVFAEGRDLVADVPAGSSTLRVVSGGKESADVSLGSATGFSEDLQTSVVVTDSPQGRQVTNRGTSPLVAVVLVRDPQDPDRRRFHSAGLVPAGQSRTVAAPPGCRIYVVDPVMSTGIVVNVPATVPPTRSSEELGWRFGFRAPGFAGLIPGISGQIARDLSLEVSDLVDEFNPGDTLTHTYRDLDIQGFGFGLGLDLQLLVVSVNVLFGTGRGSGNVVLRESGFESGQGTATFDVKGLIEIGGSVYLPLVHYLGESFSWSLGPQGGLWYMSMDVRNVESDLVKILPNVDLDDSLKLVGWFAGLETRLGVRISDSIWAALRVGWEYLFGPDVKGSKFEGTLGVEIRF